MCGGSASWKFAMAQAESDVSARFRCLSMVFLPKVMPLMEGGCRDARICNFRVP
eukprot:IDg4721t1